jgi:hypothetical protein
VAISGYYPRIAPAFFAGVPGKPCFLIVDEPIRPIRLEMSKANLYMCCVCVAGAIAILMSLQHAMTEPFDAAWLIPLALAVVSGVTVLRVSRHFQYSGALLGDGLGESGYVGASARVGQLNAVVF